MRSNKLERKLLNALLLGELCKLETKQNPNPERETRRQNARVYALMKKAYEIPFYRERFERSHTTPDDYRCAEDLYKFPVLTKAELREWMDSEIGKPQYQDYYVDVTSGSSGTPTRILYSPREKAANMANWMRVLIKAGYNPFTGNTVSRLSATSTSAGQKIFVQKLGILRRKFINQYESEPSVIRQINESKPDLLYMNKTELMRIALYSLQNGIPVFQPKFYVPTGEMIDNHARELFTKVFGPGMIDSFGTSETGACMAKYPGSDVHRIHRDLFVVNVADENGQPASSGKLCVTPLFKTDVPLINYVVGDHAVSTVRDGVLCIAELQGRMNDFITHENGQVTTFFMIAPVFAHCEEVVQMRLIEKDVHHLLIQAVKDTGAQKQERDIEQQLTEQLEQRLKQPMQVDFEWMDVIPPDANGKLRLIVNEVAGK